MNLLNKKQEKSIYIQINIIIFTIDWLLHLLIILQFTVHNYLLTNCYILSQALKIVNQMLLLRFWMLFVS